VLITFKNSRKCNSERVLADLGIRNEVTLIYPCRRKYVGKVILVDNKIIIENTTPGYAAIEINLEYFHNEKEIDLSKIKHRRIIHRKNGIKELKELRSKYLSTI